MAEDKIVNKLEIAKLSPDARESLTWSTSFGLHDGLFPFKEAVDAILATGTEPADKTVL